MDKFIGYNLRIQLKKHGISQKQLGNEIGICREMICKYISEKKIPSTSTVEKIAAFFDVSPDFFYQSLPDRYKQKLQEEKNQKKKMEGNLSVKNIDPSLYAFDKQVSGIKVYYGTCPYCKKIISSLWNNPYCGNCGKKVKWDYHGKEGEQNAD